jgi:hypothetical protein
LPARSDPICRRAGQGFPGRARQVKCLGEPDRGRRPLFWPRSGRICRCSRGASPAPLSRTGRPLTRQQGAWARNKHYHGPSSRCCNPPPPAAHAQGPTQTSQTPQVRAAGRRPRPLPCSWCSSPKTITVHQLQRHLPCRSPSVSAHCPSDYTVFCPPPSPASLQSTGSDACMSPDLHSSTPPRTATSRRRCRCPLPPILSPSPFKL